MHRNSKETYFLANKILLGIVAFIILYPLITVSLNINMVCEYRKEYGVQCRSCGLTRGLLQCYKLNFQEALILNKQSFFVFFGLMFQLIFRLIILFFTKLKFGIAKIKWKLVASIDLLIILIIFILNIIVFP